jgi:hypothetical protein
MRWCGHVISLALTFAAVATAQSPDPSLILVATREALGGETRLAGITSFVATGRTRQVRGDNLIPIEFEISYQRPDKYVRRDEVPAQENGPTSTGFSGGRLIQFPAPRPSPGRGGTPSPPSPAAGEAAAQARLVALKHDTARWMLGLFAGSDDVAFTFAYAGVAEAPQGQADVLTVSGSDDFNAQLFVHRTTHLPVMVSWRPAPGDGSGGPGRGSPPRGDGPLASAPAPPQPPPGPGASAPGLGAETRLYFADYRDVDGVKWPFRIRRAVGADTMEETVVDRYRPNAKIDSRKFDPK